MKRSGSSDKIHTYEFLTPWLALNQQNAKKFYDLKGKPKRDAFMTKNPYWQPQHARQIP